jgi:hypothetical protein
MPDVDVEDALQLAAVEDQDPVEALAPCAADPALDVRVRVRRPDWCSDHPDPVAIEDCVESAAELRVPVVDQQPRPLAVVVEVRQQVARLQHPGTVRGARTGDVLDPAAADADEHEHN